MPIIKKRGINAILDEEVVANDVNMVKSDDFLKQRPSWEECLAKALTEMPQELARRILTTIPADILVGLLNTRDDPFLKLVAMLIKEGYIKGYLKEGDNVRH